jgi:hypothetical protein
MDDTMLMCHRQTLGQLRTEMDDLLLRQWSGRQHRIERQSVDQFFDQEVRSILGVKVVNRGDVRMVEFRECERFFVKAPSGVHFDHGSRREDFQGDVAIEAFVVGAKDHTHPACTNLFKNAVMGQCGLHGDILGRVLKLDPLGS